jgi:hypothetical protein
MLLCRSRRPLHIYIQHRSSRTIHISNRLKRLTPRIAILVNNMTSDDRIASYTGCPSQWKCRSISCQSPAVPVATLETLALNKSSRWAHDWQQWCHRSHLPHGLTPTTIRPWSRDVSIAPLWAVHWTRCVADSIDTNQNTSNQNQNHVISLALHRFPFKEGCHMYRYNVSEIARGSSH